jgi:effector-binding domain-containing protein
MAQTTYEIREKTLDPMLIAGVRMKGKYSECGQGFSKIGRAMGRYIGGAPFLLHYDHEYKEDDADFEACMPLKQAKTADGIAVRDLAGGRCICLIHKGPYDQLGHAYAKILQYAKQKGYAIHTPTREVYVKGPGMIFKGNPKNYVTEIQMLIDAPDAQKS